MYTTDDVRVALIKLAESDEENSINGRLCNIGFDVDKDTLELINAAIVTATLECMSMFLREGIPAERASASAVMAPFLMGIELFKELTGEAD